MKTAKLSFSLPISLAVVVGSLAGFSTQAWATTFFSTVGQASDSFNRLQLTTDRIASDFTTGSSATTIQSTTLTMFNNNLTNNFTAHTFTPSIFTDNAGAPGSLVGTFSTFTINAAQSIQSGFATTSGINLAANTTYWEVLQVNETATSENAGWFRTLSQTMDASGAFSIVSGTQVKSSANSGSTWANVYVGNSMFKLDGVATVPEPSTCVLAALGLLGGLFLRRRI
jgi:hypothetical protein